jgi:hypothetical protein
VTVQPDESSAYAVNQKHTLSRIGMPVRAGVALEFYQVTDFHFSSFGGAPNIQIILKKTA